jgi:hypothetical protein
MRLPGARLFRAKSRLIEEDLFDLEHVDRARSQDESGRLDLGDGRPVGWRLVERVRRGEVAPEADDGPLGALPASRQSSSASRA